MKVHPQIQYHLHFKSDADEDGAVIGCECGLLAQELRSQFTSAIVFTSKKLMHTLSVSCHVNFATLLIQMEDSFPEGPQIHTTNKEHHSRCMSGATDSEIKECAWPHFDCVNKSLLDIKVHLEDWVFISLTRGLWDNISRELFLFAVDLKEDQQNRVLPECSLRLMEC